MLKDTNDALDWASPEFSQLWKFTCSLFRLQSSSVTIPDDLIEMEMERLFVMEHLSNHPVQSEQLPADILILDGSVADSRALTKSSIKKPTKHK